MHTPTHLITSNAHTKPTHAHAHAPSSPSPVTVHHISPCLRAQSFFSTFCTLCYSDGRYDASSRTRPTLIVGPGGRRILLIGLLYIRCSSGGLLSPLFLSSTVLCLVDSHERDRPCPSHTVPIAYEHTKSAAAHAAATATTAIGRDVLDASDTQRESVLHPACATTRINIIKSRPVGKPNRVLGILGPVSVSLLLARDRNGEPCDERERDAWYTVCIRNTVHSNNRNKKY
jgi:hypothetical protein